ncbi:hypothetical protein [Tuwongella immobilis]|uniref:Uncharacterized protein n=1 Tax=Tuwongella immobilis TaxID=692036 RepID=A0A6C2YMM8_9BACT|nr:hypothetical protein [Tuwongella immobilis]VIP02172.1 unnamed protein product [Tuwongella immobilis]VTS00603.1 unnamed protein product [Tuwongella immobilis]
MPVESSSNSYCTGSQLLDYHDARLVGDLLSDAETRIAEGSIPTNPKVLAALRRASGDLESAALVGGRYKVTDLEMLTGNALEYRIGLVADLAFWHLTKRRFPATKIEDVTGAQQAMDTLELLRTGERIFGVVEVIEAHNMGTVDVSQPVDRRPTTVQMARRFFGRRNHEE